MKATFGALFMAVLSLAGCKDDDFSAAPFRCKINGKEFIANSDLISVSVSGGNNYYIQATRVANPLNDDLYGEMKLDIIVDTVGTIALNASNTWRWSNNGGDSFSSTGNDPGTLTVTSLDISGKRITGTFELTAYGGSSGTDTKSVTEGFFDVSW
jgi:hypothetical protein